LFRTLVCMKLVHHIIIGIGILLAPAFLAAQYQYELMKMSEGVENGIWFDVVSEDEKEVEEVWQDFMDERSLKVKRSSRRPKEYLAEDVKGQEVSTLFGTDLFMQAEKVDTAIRVKIWVRRGEEFPDFWGEEEAQAELKDLLDHFQLAMRQYRAEKALEEAQEKLEDMERDLSRLESRKENYEKRIEKAYEEIEENEKNIVDNESEQEALQKKLEEQRSQVSERKAARDLLKKSSVSPN